MNLLSTLAVALSALGRNLLRSFLTTLGIMIGVAAVITTVALGEGNKAQAEAAYAAMGTSLLIVLPGSTQSGGQRGGFGSQPTLTWDDLKAMQTEVPSVKSAAPGLRTSSSVLAESANWTTSVWGTTPEFFDIRNWPMSLGNRFTQSDVDTGTKVVVLGQTVSDKLFGPTADPIGQTVRIRNIPFQVVGVTIKKGQSTGGQDYDDQVVIPVSTFASKLQGGLRNYINGMIYVGATSSATTAKAEREITALLRDRHRLAPGADDDFNIRNLAELASSQAEQTRNQSLLILAIGAISLLVGGIGIMNIMLVSVSERTREIGVRMAVGAKPLDVLTQFLVEALLLSLLGGIIGVGIGIIVVNWLATSFGWLVLIRVDSVVIALAFSAAVGVIFGLYPAYKASRLDPIDALRYE